jgi:hypothetical protein
MPKVRWNAGPGWDPATGLGTPNGALLFALTPSGSTTPPGGTTQPTTPTASPPSPPAPVPVPSPNPIPSPGMPAALAALDVSGNILQQVPWRPWFSLLFLLPGNSAERHAPVLGKHPVLGQLLKDLLPVLEKWLPVLLSGIGQTPAPSAPAHGLSGISSQTVLDILAVLLPLLQKLLSEKGLGLPHNVV